jgi:hypothetical protein
MGGVQAAGGNKKAARSATTVRLGKSSERELQGRHPGMRTIMHGERDAQT